MKRLRMKNSYAGLLIWALCALLAFHPARALAEDIDIFITNNAAAAAFDNPNVLLILDNTSNWSSASQKWPADPDTGEAQKQGQAELRAIKTVIGTLDQSINVGLMMLTDNGAGRSGGYIRFPVMQMTAANKTTFQNLVQYVYDNFGSPSEKVAANAAYSPVLFDAFKYFGGYTSPANVATGTAGTPQDALHFGPMVFNQLTDATLADVRGYTDAARTTYSGPISSANSCARNFIIFIGNGFPNDDTSNDGSYLGGVDGDKAQIALPGFTTTVVTANTDLGYTSACYASQAAAQTTDFASQCGPGLAYETCSVAGTSTTTGCASGANYLVQGNSTTTQVVSNNTYAVPASNKRRMVDEWARFLYQTDVNSAAGQQNISTYTIDVFNAKQDADQTALLLSTARVGGGKYFAAKSKNAIISALKNIMSEIQATNTVFASASLPVNATNRAQNENQVFIGMFRPDPAALPRWFGNVKRYQLWDFSGVIDLADLNGNQAINLQTGFVSECATSWWTTDSNTYWQSVPNNPPAEGKCTTSQFSQWSDAPDGPLVEKGAAAEVIRKGNNPPATDSSPTWAPNRTIKTVSGASLVDFTAAGSGLAQTLVDFIAGKDVNDENANGLTTTETRPSLHGDVIHSRPVPINYSTAGNPSAGVTVFYGSNDGTLRAINANNGRERWALVAPEFFPRLSRLSDNSPIVKFPNQAMGITPSPTPKDYFWDGSMGIYQNADNSTVWLFPAMRRGGRMIYGLDVTSVDSPNLLWRLGCPNLTNDTGCSAPDGTHVSGIGQTWSTPAVAFIKGYSTTEPVLVFGGGYDSCEDADSSAPNCSSPKGAAIYIIKASDGSVIKKFTTTRSIASDIAMVDVNNDGYADYAYVADTGGNFYRVDFVDGAASYSAQSAPEWEIYRVAYTTGTGSPVGNAPRKFLFPPALLYTSGHVYVAAGSGDREHPLQGSYPYTDVLNRFYVYLDTLAVKPTTPTDADPAKRPVNLDDVTLMNDNTASTTCASDKILASSSKKGWFMDLNQHGQGEQTVTSALILSGQVTFSTNRPIPPAAGSCSTTLGEARGYWVNLLNGSGGIGAAAGSSCGGTRSDTFVGGGLPPSPVTGVVPVNGESRTVVIGAVKRDGNASAPIGGQKVVPAIKPVRKRVYWFKNIDN